MEMVMEMKMKMEAEKWRPSLNYLDYRLSAIALLFLILNAR